MFYFFPSINIPREKFCLISVGQQGLWLKKVKKKCSRALHGPQIEALPGPGPRCSGPSPAHVRQLIRITGPSATRARLFPPLLPKQLTHVSHILRLRCVFFSAPILTDQSVHTARGHSPAVRSRSGAEIVYAQSLFLLCCTRWIKVTALCSR